MSKFNDFISKTQTWCTQLWHTHSPLISGKQPQVKDCLWMLELCHQIVVLGSTCISSWKISQRWLPVAHSWKIMTMIRMSSSPNERNHQLTNIWINRPWSHIQKSNHLPYFKAIKKKGEPKPGNLRKPQETSGNPNNFGNFSCQGAKSCGTWCTLDLKNFLFDIYSPPVWDSYWRQGPTLRYCMYTGEIKRLQRAIYELCDSESMFQTRASTQALLSNHHSHQCKTVSSKTIAWFAPVWSCSAFHECGERQMMFQDQQSSQIQHAWGYYQTVSRIISPVTHSFLAICTNPIYNWFSGARNDWPKDHPAGGKKTCTLALCGAPKKARIVC